MSITAQDVKKLREQTGLGFLACRHALEIAKGDLGAAQEALLKESGKISAKKSGRALGAGIVDSYIHATGKIGVLVELRSETDFVANNNEFRALAHNIAMHIAATDPESVKELLEGQYIKDPDQTIGKLVEGATQKFGERIEVANFSRIDAS